jgi:YbbR domain-containing protein
MIIQMLANRLGVVCIGVLLAFGFFLWVSNINLKKQHQILTFTTQDQEQIITIQKKVISVVKNTKSTNLAGNIKRMQDGEL